MTKLELALVMPVYNEEACIVEVVQSWQATLSRLGMPYQVIVLNDGSTDRTAEKLASLEGDPAIVAVNKTNSGHGPTILEGYRMAVERAPWVFQCDSDNEMPADRFPALWTRRENYDALFGIRDGRTERGPETHHAPAHDSPWRCSSARGSKMSTRPTV